MRGLPAPGVVAFYAHLLDDGRTGAQQFQVLNDSRLLAHLFLDETGSMPTAAGHRRHRFADGDGPFRSASTATQLDGFIQRLYGTIFFFLRTGAELRPSCSNLTLVQLGAIVD